MRAKSFMLLVAAVLVLGGSLGGAFVGGIALGKGQGAEAAEIGVMSRPVPGLGQQFSGQSDGASLQQLRQRIQSGQATSEELAELRQQFGSGQGFRSRGGLSGTIEAIDGNTVTVNTSQGALRATIGAETTIQMLAEGTLADLLEGMRVTVVGQRGDDGSVQASSIFIAPEGADAFFGGGFFSGAGQEHEKDGASFFGDGQQHEQQAP